MSDLNDPRVLFAAERTLLAWSRTSLSMMAFGFVIERFGLFVEMAGKHEIVDSQRHLAFVLGISFIVIATFLAVYSGVQHWRVLKTLRPAEIPAGYDTHIGMVVNGAIALLGLLLAVYLLGGFMA